MADEQEWTEIIKPKRRLLDINLKELYKYRDLVFLFVKRDFVAVYKQTVLGPIWYLAQPLLTALMLYIMFGRVAKLSTDGQVPFLFYYAGIVAWQYFAQTLLKTSNTFVANAGMFGKVYFPRLSVPVSLVISNLIGFGIQFFFLIVFLLLFLFFGEGIGIENITFDWYMLFLIVDLLTIAMLGLGLGIMISALTVKYRDLIYFITFGIQLMMYATPVIIPMSKIPAPFDSFVRLNPMTPVIENFRGIFLRSEYFYKSVPEVLWMLGLSFVILFFGLILFNKTEKNFMDTV
jgi:lipopolysaccharide transport system permease protein